MEGRLGAEGEVVGSAVNDRAQWPKQWDQIWNVRDSFDGGGDIGGESDAIAAPDLRRRHDVHQQAGIERTFRRFMLFSPHRSDEQSCERSDTVLAILV